MTTTAVSTVRQGRQRRRRRSALSQAALLTLALVLFIAMVMLGNTIYPVSDVLAVLRGETVPGASFAVGTLRLPRALGGAMAGMAFGIAGTTFQTMLRNPLASPDVIGITAGASAAAMFALVGMHWSATITLVVALAAGVSTALVIYWLARGGESTGGRLILIGIGIGAMLNAVVAFLIQRAAEWDVAVALRWLSGSLNGTRWDSLPPLALALAIIAPLMVILAKDLQALELGEEFATTLGVRTERVRILLILGAVALACFATATTGPIAFVAFLAGPIARRIIGPGVSTIIPAALMGMCLVLGADLIGQFGFDTRFPVGVITGIIGAPYLLVLLINNSRRGGSA